MGARRIAVFCLVVLGTAFVASDLAAGVSPGTTAKAKPPDGYHTVTLNGAGFSMVVPDTWLALDPASKSFRDLKQQIAEADPELADFVKQIKASDVSLFALDRTNPNFASNAIVTPSSGYDKSAVSQPKAVKAELEAQGGAEGVEVHKTKVDGRRALEAFATQQVTLRDGSSAQAHGTLYFVPAEKDLLEIVFVTLSDGREDPTVQTMIDSFKLSR